MNRGFTRLRRKPRASARGGGRRPRVAGHSGAAGVSPWGFTHLRLDPRVCPRFARFCLPTQAPGTHPGGFTLPETVVALAVFGVLSLLSMPFLFSFYADSLFQDAVEQVTQDVRRSQALAIAGENDSSQGVFFDPVGERWVLFAGSSYVEGAATNEVHVLPSAVDLVSVTLSGGGSSVVFAERFGRTTNAGSVVLRSGSRQATIAVNAAGGVSRQ